jgi:hypothetical protein
VVPTTESALCNFLPMHCSTNGNGVFDHPREILSIIIEANFRNWNDAQQKSMTNFFHDMKAEVRNQPLSHIFLHASKFPNWRTVKCSHYYNYLMLIINN